MSKAKLCVIGHFDRSNAFDGQTIKTIEIVDALAQKYGDKEVHQISYHAIKNAKFKLMRAILFGFMHAEKVIVIANTTSVPTLLRVCTLVNKLFCRDIHFILVGGALPSGMDANPAFLPILKQMKGIYLETQTLRRELSERGLDNLYMLPNFKTIRRYTVEEIPKSYDKPYKLIYMSRVTAEKGVTEMIREIRKINEKGVKYTLDIYGIINGDYAAEFEKLKSEFPDYIVYHGLADPHATSQIMHDFFLHVLPTKCPTEGQPASVIDTFFAGLPVLVGRWNSCGDMVAEGVTGVSFELGNYDEFREKLEYFYDHPETVDAMRANCVKEAEKFIPEAAFAEFIKVLEG